MVMAHCNKNKGLLASGELMLHSSTCPSLTAEKILLLHPEYVGRILDLGVLRSSTQMVPSFVSGCQCVPIRGTSKLYVWSVWQPLPLSSEILDFIFRQPLIRLQKVIASC